MSQDHLEARVGELERETVRQGATLSRVERDVSTIGLDVKQLLEANLRRPEPMNLKAVAAICSAVVAVAVVGWWLVEHSPALLELRTRVTKLEWRLENPVSWGTTITPRR